MDNSLRKEIFIWMNRNPDKIRDMKITDVAAQFFTTPPTVTKALQQFGYKGYKEFQHVIFSNLAINATERSFVINNITENISTALNDVKFGKEIASLFNQIKQNNSVYIMGKGHSLMIAEYLKRLIFFHYNVHVEIVKDTYQLLSLKDSSLFIGISLDKSTKLLNDMAEKVSCKKILITKVDAQFKKVKESNFDTIVTVPSAKKSGENHDNPVSTKAILELALSIYINNGGE